MISLLKALMADAPEYKFPVYNRTKVTKQGQLSKEPFIRFIVGGLGMVICLTLISLLAQ